MRKVRLGGTLVNGIPVYLEETHVENQDVQPGNCFTVSLEIQDKTIEMNLKEVRNLRFLLARAEQQILLRNEQALKAKNFNLDF